MPASEITAYLARIVANSKDIGHPLRTSKGDYNKPGWIEQRDVMSWHVLGRFPERLFKKKRPSEDPEWYEYRKTNYQPVTKGPIRDVMKDSKRSFAESNWVIRDLDEETRDYMQEERFDGVTFMTWMNNRALEEMILDPHSCVVVMPTGPGMIDGDQRADVELWLVESIQIIERKDGFFCWKAYEESPYKSGGEVYYFIDADSYWLAEETKPGAQGRQFILTELYQHLTGTTTNLVQELGGWTEYRKGVKFYRSWFEGYLPFANDVIEEYSTYRVGYGMMGFPIRKEYEKICDYQDDSGNRCGGHGYWEVNNKEVTCPKCKGTGYAPPIHPGHVIEIPRPEPGETVVDELSYVHIPVDSVKDMRESWNNLLERAKEAISLRFIMEKQSGVAKEMDREGGRAMMEVIAEWFFGTVIENIIYGVVKIRRPLDYQNNKPSVIVPNDFKLKDSGVLLVELQEIGKTSTASGIYVEKVREYCDKAFGNDLFTKRKVELQMILDPLAVYSIEEKNAMKAAGSITTRECTISAHAYSDIEMLVEDNGQDTLLNPDSWWRDLWEKLIADKYPEVEEPTFNGAFEDEEEDDE